MFRRFNTELSMEVCASPVVNALLGSELWNRPSEKFAAPDADGRIADVDAPIADGISNATLAIRVFNSPDNACFVFTRTPYDRTVSDR